VPVGSHLPRPACKRAPFSRSRPTGAAPVRTPEAGVVQVQDGVRVWVRSECPGAHQFGRSASGGSGSDSATPSRSYMQQYHAVATACEPPARKRAQLPGSPVCARRSKLTARRCAPAAPPLARMGWGLRLNSQETSGRSAVAAVCVQAECDRRRRPCWQQLCCPRRWLTEATGGAKVPFVH
jgi:hypothetical protein